MYRRIRLYVFLLIICLCTWMIPGTVFAEENTETNLKGHSFVDVITDEGTHHVCSVCGIDYSEYEESGTACKRNVTYIVSDEEIVKSYNYGESVRLMEAYTLTGWNSEADGSGTSYIFGENDIIPSIEQDMILYGIPKGHRIAIENVTGHGSMDVLADLQNTLEGEYVEFCIYAEDDYALHLLEITKDDDSGEAISYDLFPDEVPVVDDPEYEYGSGSQILSKGGMTGSFIMPTCDVKMKVSFDFKSDAMGDQNTYTVALNLDHGGLDVQIVAEGDKAIKPKDPVRRGYVFDGWYYYPDLTMIEDCVDLYPFDKPVTHNINLIGKWKKTEEQQEEELIRVKGHVFRKDIPECIISYDFDDHPFLWECLNCGAETTDPYSDIGTCEGDGSHPGQQDEYHESDPADLDDGNEDRGSAPSEEIAKPVIYSVTGGAYASWTKGSSESVMITVKRGNDDESCFSHYTETLIDGTPVVVSAKAGSTVVTISAQTLEKLSTGIHTVTVEFDDGRVDTKLTVKAAEIPVESVIPKTGDNSNVGLWFSLLCLSGAALAVLIKTSGKRE